jgi:hypothetical protein
MQLKRIGRGVVVGAMVVVVGAVGCRFGRRCRRNVANDNNAKIEKQAYQLAAKG